MQKVIATRVEDEEKEKFRKLAENLKMNESVLLRLIISTLVEHPEFLEKIINELHKKVKTSSI